MLTSLGGLLKALESEISASYGRNKELWIEIKPWVKHFTNPFAIYNGSNGVEYRDDVRSARIVGLSVAFESSSGPTTTLSAEIDGSYGELRVLKSILELPVRWSVYDVKPLLFCLFGERIYPEWHHPLFDLRVVASVLFLGRFARDPHLASLSTGSNVRLKIEDAKLHELERDEALSLDGLLKYFCDITMYHHLPKQIGWGNVPDQEYEDEASALLPLTNAILRDVQKRPGLSKYLHQIELPFSEAGAWIEWNGIRLDPMAWRDLVEWYRYLGKDHFHNKRVNSFRSNSRWFFGRDLPLGFDSRVHPVHIQNAASTGRSSFKSPKIPHLSKELRNLVSAAPGNTLLDCDYVQFELSIAAARFNDSKTMELCSSGDAFGSLSSEHAAIWKGFSRSETKASVHMWLNGGGPKTLVRELGISLDAATKIFAAIESKLPVIKAGMDQLERIGLEQGFAEIFPGLHRGPPDKPGSSSWTRSWLRNTPLQGLGAVIHKKGLVELYREFRGSETKCILTNHDSVLIETPIIATRSMRDLVEDILNKAAQKILPGVPTRAKGVVGIHWASKDVLRKFQDQLTSQK